MEKQQSLLPGRFLLGLPLATVRALVKVEARIRVIYGDTDQMGVVYYANYFRYFEFARGEFLRAQGASYRELEKEGALLPVIQAHCEYKASAKYDDVLVIEADVTEVRRATFTFEYQVRRENDPTVLSIGKTVHAAINREGRPVRLPESWITLLGGRTPPLT